MLEEDEVFSRIVTNVNILKEKLREHGYSGINILLENVSYFTNCRYVWRTDFMDTLAEAQAEKYDVPVETQRKILLTRDKQRQLGRNVKRMRGKLGKNSTSKIFVTTDSVRREKVPTNHLLGLIPMP